MRAACPGPAGSATPGVRSLAHVVGVKQGVVVETIIIKYTPATAYLSTYHGTANTQPLNVSIDTFEYVHIAV